MKKYEKGITLIALVITIIILLILAGIAIRALSGENAILTKALQSKDATRIATIKEAIDLWKMEKLLDEYSQNHEQLDLNNLLNDLEAQGLITSQEREKIKEERKT